MVYFLLNVLVNTNCHTIKLQNTNRDSLSDIGLPKKYFFNALLKTSQSGEHTSYFQNDTNMRNRLFKKDMFYTKVHLNWISPYVVTI